MPEQFTAAQEALHKFAKSSDQRAEKLREIRSKLASHSLNPEAFGKLPEAGELYTAYSEQSEDCLEILQAAATLEEKVGEGVTETARAYQADEDETVRTMEHVQGGAGGAR
ncbi:hypothetical protein [Streptomyces sp. NPDC017529]|uniref:hypothetical protein n=1 Tax=Streptomyces sp. NPDC017529 TaxID=3365000 RepID=UPI00379C365F